MCDFFSGHVSDTEVVYYDGLHHELCEDYHHLRMDIREEWSEFEWTENRLEVRHKDPEVARRRKNVILSIYENRQALIDEWHTHEDYLLAAVKSSAFSIRFMNNTPESVQLEAVKKRGQVIKHIINPSDKVKLAAIEYNGTTIRYMQKYPFTDKQIVEIKKYGKAQTYDVDSLPESTKLKAVEQTGWAIQYIKNPSEDVQIVAVKESGRSIQFIKDPSEDVKLAAIKKNGLAIKFIEDPSESLQMVAVKGHPPSIRYIENPSKKVVQYLTSRNEQ